MPNDLTIRPIAPSAPEPASGTAAQTAQALPEEAAPQTAMHPDAMPNPTLRLDQTLGMVVIEFHNSAGSVTSSIPGQRQLDAYRMARELDNAPDTAPGTAPPVHPSATRTV